MNLAESIKELSAQQAHKVNVIVAQLEYAADHARRLIKSTEAV